MKSLLTFFLLASTMAPLVAQNQTFVGKSTSASLIELYSSEGCSSCPPAEAWLNSLKSAPGLWKDIFPVAFHVDYWDNLGWPDRFANAAYTQRQRTYANRFGSDSVYTPEFIANGLEWRRSFFGGGQIPSEQGKSGVLTLSVNEKEKTISADYTPAGSAPSRPLVINVALLGFHLLTDVKRGENAGSQLDHEFVVLGFASSPLTAGTDGKYQNTGLALGSSTDDKPGAVVAWVSRDDGGILQITGGWLSSAAPLGRN